MIKNTLMTLLFLVGNVMAFAQTEFISTWQVSTDGERITIPTLSTESYNYNVDWGDGSEAASGATGNTSHTYTNAGVYTIKISGTFPTIHFNNSGDKNKILSIEQWGDIAWATMWRSFYGCSNLVLNATDAPDLSHATSIAQMFRKATSLTTNEAMNTWNTSTITNMWNVFNGASNFNQDISNWNVSNVVQMGNLFRGSSFNHDISGWDVSKVIKMQHMFRDNKVFNQDLSAWDVSRVENMKYMFSGASAFNQSLANWDISSVNNIGGMLNNCGMSSYNYDQTLIGWSALNLVNKLTFGASGLTYCTGSTARATIINDKSWTFSGDSQDCDAFITTWTVSEGDTITIPTNSAYTYEYTVDWGDGSEATSGATGNVSHIYTATGTYQVEIRGSFPAIYFNESGNSLAQIQDIAQWGNNEWLDMSDAFSGCSNLTISAIDAPDLSQVTSLNLMLAGTAINQDIGHWNTATITDMGGMFILTPFNQDISAWNMDQVETINAMFAFSEFNQNIGTWNTSSITNMSGVFRGAANFNQDISAWNTANVENMSLMFSGAESFNQDISNWNTDKVTNMLMMFNLAQTFNQDISGWDVGAVTNMSRMFNNAYAFDQVLMSWDISNVSDVTSMLSNSGMSTAKYDSTLMGWAALDLVDGLTLGADGLSYCDAATRQSIIDNNGWTISGDINACFNPFITTWNIADSTTTVTIPTNSAYAYDYTIDWGDGNVETNVTDDAVHAYATPGDYSIEIRGTFPAIYFNGNGDNLQHIQDVAQWGDVEWQDMSYAFYGCANLGVSASDAPDLSNVTSLDFMLASTSINQDISSWNLASITTMRGLFFFTPFNQDISGWNTANVENMNALFLNTPFNQDISGWDVGNVTNMSTMFRSATAFNQDISNWNTASVDNMNAMFLNAHAFNQDISGWNIESVTSTSYMFNNASGFNQDISSWNVDGVNNMQYMFYQASAFNQNLSSWDISNVTDVTGMLSYSALSMDKYDSTLMSWVTLDLVDGLTLGANGLTYCVGQSARQDIIDNHSWTISGDINACFDPFITTWNIADSTTTVTIPTNSAYIYDYTIDWGDGNVETNVTGDATHTYATPSDYSIEIRGTFPAIYFNGSGDNLQHIQDVAQWGDVEWQDMSYAFYGCANLGVSASDAPDLSNVTSLDFMLASTSINQDISSWNLASITTMRGLFFFTPFNQDISGWNTANVENMNALFLNTPFNQDISGWDVGNVTNMSTMFRSATAFNQDISNWNTASVDNMNAMFLNAHAFNQDISGWNIENVTSTSYMFNNASGFNQDISSWNVDGVNNMQYMFYQASAFNQNLSSWDISNVTDVTGMLSYSALSMDKYDSTLMGWAALDLVDGLTLGADSLMYCVGQSARQDIIDNHNWTIAGDSFACGRVASSTNSSFDNGLIIENAADVKIWSSQNQIHIDFQNAIATHSEVVIYDTMGRIVKQINNSSGTNLTITLNNTGVYIVRVINTEGGYSQKVMLK